MSFLLRIAVLPIAPIWWIYAFAKRLFYQNAFLRRYKSTLKTIVVGNMAMGGTGKTPFALHIIAFLQKEQIDVAYLSRGYGRQSRGLVRVETKSKVEHVGDEALLVKLRFPNIAVLVCEDRKEGLQYLEKSRMCKAVILDDAFQHLRIEATHYFLLSVFAKPYFNDFIFPIGTLREPRYFAKEGQTLVYTKSPKNLSLNELNHYTRKSPKTSDVLFTSVDYSNYLQPLFAENTQPISKDIHVFAFAGTASNAHFFSEVALNFSLIKELNYPDHHHFLLADLQYIQRIYWTLIQDKGVKNLIILCTEKDAVRLRTHEWASLLKLLPLYYWPIEIAMSQADQEKLNHTISEILC